MNKIKKIVVLGSGTAGLISSLVIRELYPLAEITILSSKEIGIIGVGEGSTEHWDAFMRFVGINHIELIAKTDATIKIGVFFKDWNIGEEYVHSISNHNNSPLFRPETFNSLLLLNKEPFPLSPGFFNSYYKNRVVLNPGLRPSNQYHFDTFKLNNYLKNKCTERNITFIDGIVSDVKINETGDVTSLIIEDGNYEIEGDFFIDSSGFKRVISSKLGCKWSSYKEYLPVNHAIAFPTEFDNPTEIEPFTTATALTSGWSWKIPTQNRYGNGYVFCDSYISKENALREISDKLGKNIEKEARDIKFEAGRVDKFWVNNVVNIGLSGSFAEPLEAQSIGFSIVQSFSLVKLIDSWQLDKNISSLYNKTMNKVFDNIIDFVQLHYVCKREDSTFWKEKPYRLTNFNQEYLPLMCSGVMGSEVLFQEPDLMFRNANFFQVLAGLDLIDKGSVQNQRALNREVYNQECDLNALRVVNDSSNALLINHKDFLNLVKYNFEIRNEN